MPQNIYFDNNFFNSRLAQCDPHTLAQHFTSTGLQWCLSEELLLELFNSIRRPENTKNRQMMQRWALFCLALWPNSKVLRNYSQIICEESEGKPLNIFREKEETGPIKGLLGELSKGKFSSNILLLALRAVDEIKNSDELFRQKLQGLRQKGARELPSGQFLKVFLKKNLSDERVRKIMSNLSAFPHVRTFSFVAPKLSYKRTGKGHLFDGRHLVYVTDMDYFVTDDNPTATLAGQIFSVRPKVFTQEEFFSTLA